MTRSKIANQFARQTRHMRSPDRANEDDSSLGGLKNAPDARQAEEWEQVWEDEWQKNLMESAIRRVKERVSIEQYQMFDLFVLKAWPAREVAKTLGVTTAPVYVAKHRISKLIRKEVEALKAKPI